MRGLTPGVHLYGEVAKLWVKTLDFNEMGFLLSLFLASKNLQTLEIRVELKGLG